MDWGGVEGRIALSGRNDAKLRGMGILPMKTRAGSPCYVKVQGRFVHAWKVPAVPVAQVTKVNFAVISPAEVFTINGASVSR